jgi:hypothetical protein
VQEHWGAEQAAVLPSVGLELDERLPAEGEGGGDRGDELPALLLAAELLGQALVR